MLDIKRQYSLRKDRLDITFQMHALWEKCKSKLKSDSVNTFNCFCEDYLVHKNLDKAEESLWKAFKERENSRNDEKEIVIKEIVSCKF